MIDPKDIKPGLSDLDEPRPKRMKRPPFDEGHWFHLFGRGSRGGLYIQDELSDMLKDKYGEERGEKNFQGILEVPGGAFFQLGDTIAREKTSLIRLLGLEKHADWGDYFQWSYYDLWTQWMKNIGANIKVQTKEEAQAEKEEKERLKLAAQAEIKRKNHEKTVENAITTYDKFIESIKNNLYEFIDDSDDTVVTPKDEKRVSDMFSKGNVINLAERMAKSIKDPNKAKARAFAVKQYIDDNIDDNYLLYLDRFAIEIFLRRYKELIK